MLTKLAVAPRRSAPLALSSCAAPDDQWLPKIAAEEVTLLNALYRHRRPIEALVAGHAVTIELAARIPPDPDALWFRVMLAGQAAQLRVPARLVDHFTQPVATGRLDGLGAVQAGMLLELALLDPIKALEAALGMDIRIAQRIETADHQDGKLIVLPLTIRGLPDGDAAAALCVDRQNASRIARALDQLAIPNAVTERLAVPIRLCVNAVDLTFAELRTLRPGDIVLPELGSEQPGAIVAVVGEHLRCEVERAAEGFRLVSGLVSGLAHARGDAAGEWFMQQPTDTFDTLRRPPADDPSLEQLPVRLVFEVGRLDLPLTEVRRLAPGYVLPLAKPSENAVDVVANGRKIGHGSLMMIGDSIGVRIERLFSDE